MKHPINNQYQLASDQYQWMIQKPIRRKKDGKEYISWESFKYYSTLDGAINGLGNLSVMTSDAQTLAEALEEVKKISTELSHAITPSYAQAIKETTVLQDGLE